MYGLTSRESLARRQSRWVCDIDEELGSNFSKNISGNKSIPKSPSDDFKIISSMNDSCISFSEDKSDTDIVIRKSPIVSSNHLIPNNSEKTTIDINNLREDIKAVNIKMKTHHKILKDGLAVNSNLSDKLEHMSEKLNDIILRVQKLESSSNSDNNMISKLVYTDEGVVGRCEFVPYYIDEDYVGCDSVTKLEKLHFNMLVEILGLCPGDPIIFPFGTETNLPKFATQTLEMKFTDADLSTDSTISGCLKHRDDGIYILELAALCPDNPSFGIEQFTFPITLTCDTDLILE